ncbi:hypothetical protein [Nitrosomonas halophila]|uniref:hypothetical protein n=1 Tax=Nitrosomonas halophila TaxID=44576 RepID=UPI0015A098F9|nr:hypothetical protein [Nitrosomonas halophila]
MHKSPFLNRGGGLMPRPLSTSPFTKRDDANRRAAQQGRSLVGTMPSVITWGLKWSVSHSVLSYDVAESAGKINAFC